MRVVSDYSLVAQPLGAKTGTQTVFPLTITGGQIPVDPQDIVVRAVHQTDWSGRHPLYPFARTNYVTYSTDPSQWGSSSLNPPVKVQNAGVAPDGTTTACQLNCTAGNGVQVIDSSTVPIASAGIQVTATVYVKYVSGDPVTRILVVNPAWGPSYFWGMIIDLQAGTILLANQTYWAKLEPVGNGWFKVTFTGVSKVTGPPSLQVGKSNGQTGSLQVWGGQMETYPLATGLIVTGSSVGTVTDYTVNGSNIVVGSPSPNGALLDWDGQMTAGVMTAMPTVLSQYANSPILMGLIDYFNQWIDPAADIDNFYNTVWNVATAVGFGLDIWGRIVGVPRKINIVPLPNYFGFNEALPGSFPFNQQPFFNGVVSNGTFELSDDSYRVLIMTKALANISSFTAPSVNALLSTLFKGRGSCYVQEIGPMAIEYVFNFALQTWEASVIQQSDLMPRPAGVSLTIVVNA